jgi:hypothetical protein
MRSTALVPSVMLLALAGCSATAVSGPAGESGSDCMATAAAPACSERIATLDAELRRLIGAAACDTGTDCRTLPLGAKPCGGPARYVVYSMRGLDEAAFRSVVTELNRLQRRQADALARAGAVSDCSIVSDPGAECRAGQCVPGPR